MDNRGPQSFFFGLIGLGIVNCLVELFCILHPPGSERSKHASTLQ